VVGAEVVATGGVAFLGQRAALLVGVDLEQVFQL
jgi:hypothetical protein